MLQQILMYLNNWFVYEKFYDMFQITEGGISLPFLKNGQYFRIMGSGFNDGLYQYPVENLTDETFAGSIWVLAVPKDVIQIAEEITEFESKNKLSPYTSESFGGYSYSKPTNSKGVPISWKEVFASRLKPYKKLKGCEYESTRRFCRDMCYYGETKNF